MNLEIPEGLGDMLRDFTIAVLRERPADLDEFAVQYFSKIRDSRKTKSVPMYIIVDDDEEASEPDPSSIRPKNQKNRFARRHSVSAERYDPSEDNDDSRVSHPKSDEQRERLLESVGGILIFRSLDSDQMSEVIDAMFEKRVTPGEHVIKQGDDGDNFYVIESGVFDVSVQTDDGPQMVHQFDNKGSFGELALMYNMPRSASVIGITAGTLWAMDRKSFRCIILKSAFKKRKYYEELLESVPMLKSLDRYERMNLADALTSQTKADGECIIREGENANGMYFIEDGLVKVTITKAGKEVEVSRQKKEKSTD